MKIGTAVFQRLYELLTPDVARELAAPYGDQIVFPDRVETDAPGDQDRRFPGWPGAVVTISVENQGVCAWGVPTHMPEPPVVVGGEIRKTTGTTKDTIVYAAGLEAFIAARRWDMTCHSQPYGISAQTDEIDATAIQALRNRYAEQPPSAGWPGHTVLRFEAGETKVLLWNWTGQCDWWISDPDPEQLYLETRNLTNQFGLLALVPSTSASNEIAQRLRSPK